MEAKDWTVLMDALRILSPALGGWAIYLLRQILTKLEVHNVRLTKLEDWQSNHDKTDDLRFAHTQRQLDHLNKE